MDRIACLSQVIMGTEEEMGLRKRWDVSRRDSHLLDTTEILVPSPSSHSEDGLPVLKVI